MIGVGELHGGATLSMIKSSTFDSNFGSSDLQNNPRIPYYIIDAPFTTVCYLLPEGHTCKLSKLCLGCGA